jgi:hypothetical protein
MRNRNEIDVYDFREWVRNAPIEDLEYFIILIEREILDLEEDDFFGTEGLNKRFA